MDEPEEIYTYSEFSSDESHSSSSDEAGQIQERKFEIKEENSDLETIYVSTDESSFSEFHELRDDYGIKGTLYKDVFEKFKGVSDSSSDSSSVGCCDLQNKKRHRYHYDSSVSSISSFDSSNEFDSKVSYFMAHIVVGLNFLYKIILAMAAAIVCLNLIVSFYSVIIINFVFFISTIVSYALSPLFHGLSKDIFLYVLSLLQIILANPLIEFFILYIINTVKNFVDSIFEFISTFKFLFLFAISSGYNKLKFASRSYGDQNIIRQLGLVLASILALAASAGLTYIIWFIDKMMIFLGMIPYALMVVQIILVMIPTYFYWGRIIFGIKSTDPVFSENFIVKIINKYENFITDAKPNEGVQTYHSTFLDKKFNPLELSSQSFENSGESNEDDNEKKRKEFDDMKNKQIKQIKQHLLPLVVAIEYVPLFDYTLDIAHDRFRIAKKRFFLILFSILNFLVIFVDLYRLYRDYSVYFMISIIARIIFFPLISYFHLVTALMYRAKRKLLHGIITIATSFTILIFLASIAGLIYSYFYSNLIRIDNLEYIPNSNTSDLYIINDICTRNYEGISMIDAFGLSLGPYDIERNYTIFDNQMKYFFGENWKDFIKYEVHYVNKQTPFIIYTINESVIVYGFRGFSSGSEFSLQIEMFTVQYVLPFFQDIVPFYEFMIDYFIDFYAKFAHNFGNQFFDPIAMSSLFLDPIEEIYQSKNYDKDTKILFTGINIGGLFSKTLAMINKKQGIGFISFPVFNDYLQNYFDFEDDDSIYITNVYNYNGLYSMQEPNLATNIGIPQNEHQFSVDTDSVYKTFCTIAEMCGEGPKFSNYCSSTVENMDEIREYLKKFNT